MLELALLMFGAMVAGSITFLGSDEDHSAEEESSDVDDASSDEADLLDGWTSEDSASRPIQDPVSDEEDEDQDSTDGVHFRMTFPEIEEEIEGTNANDRIEIWGDRSDEQKIHLDDQFPMVSSTAGFSIDALDGNDTLSIVGGATYSDLGPGDDTATITDGIGVVQGGAGDDFVFIDGGVEDIGSTIDGGADDDVLTGGTESDQIIGGTGDDLLQGSCGDDTLSGGPGMDRFYGGEGNDILDGRAATYGGIDSGTYVWDDLEGGGQDELYGGAGNDTLGLSTGDLAVGGSGDDTFVIYVGGGLPGIDLPYIVDFDPTSDQITIVKEILTTEDELALGAELGDSEFEYFGNVSIRLSEDGVSSEILLDGVPCVQVNSIDPALISRISVRGFLL